MQAPHPFILPHDKKEGKEPLSLTSCPGGARPGRGTEQ